MDKALLLKPEPLTKNRAGGAAYSFDNQEKLAQYAATGFFGSTYYTAAREQLDEVLKLCSEVPDEYIAKCAIYARQQGKLKDMPALLLAVLAARRSRYFRRCFDGVIDNGKMLHNFVQILRSGITGRHNLGYAPRHKIEAWLNSRSLRSLFKDSVGTKPTLKQVLQLVRPNTFDPERRAFYGYLTGDEVRVCKPRIKGGERDNKMIEHIIARAANDNHPYMLDLDAGAVVVTRYDAAKLPQFIREYEEWKKTRQGPVPDVDWRFLDSLALTKPEWAQVAKRAPWLMTVKNLATFERHGCFTDPEVVDIVADRLKNAEAIKKSRAFPYQILSAYKAVLREPNPWQFRSPSSNDNGIPAQIVSALHDAMEIAIENVPFMDADVAVCLDVSGSMHSPVTGARGTATTSVRCVDAAALFAAAFMRRARRSLVLPFDTRCYEATPTPSTTIMGLATQLAKFGGGGTNCELPLAEMNKRRLTPDVVIYVSDNESWAGGYYGNQTGMMEEWHKLKKRSPKSKLVCIDIAAATSTQAPSAPDRLNVGGFSDSVFSVVADFLTGDRTKWVDHIEAVAL